MVQPAVNQNIIEVNKEILGILREYLPADSGSEGVEIIFGAPEKSKFKNITVPTVNVFLFDIHEDLQLNSSQSPDYNYLTRSFAPGKVNMCCNYIITFWDTVSDTSDVVESQSMMVMNTIINALINNRTLKNIPGAYTRVMPPKDGLNSLGNFWQALDNNPRLVLNLSVTVPITLAEAVAEVAPVTKTEAKLVNKALTKVDLEVGDNSGALGSGANINDSSSDTCFKSDEGVEQHFIELSLINPTVLQQLAITGFDLEPSDNYVDKINNAVVTLLDRNNKMVDTELWRGTIRGVDRASQQVIFDQDLPAQQVNVIRLERSIGDKIHPLETPGLVVAELQAFAYPETPMLLEEAGD
ncbi:Protein of unknown function (DUF4255) [Shewanella psychrophila]|uniref:Pvc16 N-terminal domain-containing protein n=1 Tax=Shewanella psychrophila TaxID=225848 RepID=A0A1S6HM91_9GAMM|nr:Pvc16 family protein [Shewanella psychrophila]AQS36633.1 Protein of unknown function (DUF4255) [Shewanella psychrophila]